AELPPSISPKRFTKNITLQTKNQSNTTPPSPAWGGFFLVGRAMPAFSPELQFWQQIIPQPLSPKKKKYFSC
ncbi:MAG: hypothetical protein KAR11_09365, partial [Phycisphaerae bacterium]|nr:hypothetical protein [Phycisphaerae bacterium]